VKLSDLMGGDRRDAEDEPVRLGIRLPAHPYLKLRDVARGRAPSRWDVIAFVLIFGTFAVIALSATQLGRPLAVWERPSIDLRPSALPLYALYTTLRMLAAMVASLIFSILYAYLAAKSRRAERLLVPLLDILQSVPILGFLTFTVTFFLGLFPGLAIGAELASVFAIFTSQAWNMTFSVYQSLRTLPPDLVEACKSLRFTGTQRFFNLELPFAMPGLIWNMMMSMSGGWFFVVASEAMTVGNQTITLPGVGSYVAAAITHRDLGAIGWAIAAMLVVILAYDQFLFRPLIAWGERFRADNEPGTSAPESWLLRVLQRSRLVDWITEQFRILFDWLLRPTPHAEPDRPGIAITLPNWTPRALDTLWYAALGACAVYGAWAAFSYIHAALTLNEIVQVLGLAVLTLIRVTILVAVASLIWVPLGVMIGLRPKLAAIAQPIAQFLAAFPSNLFFPVAVFAVLRFQLNPDIWLSPLMILGTQWYILFNVIAGASVYPHDLRDAAQNLHLRGWLWWKRAMIPGILPYYVTGAMTAAGGSWNAAIVAEFVDWGDTHLQAHGLGAYIQQATHAGDYPRVVLGIAVMSMFVIACNRLLWRPLYGRAELRAGTDKEASDG